MSDERGLGGRLLRCMVIHGLAKSAEHMCIRGLARRVFIRLSEPNSPGVAEFPCFVVYCLVVSVCGPTVNANSVPANYVRDLQRAHA